MKQKNTAIEEKVIVHAAGHVTADPLKLMKARLTVTKKMRTKSIGRYEYQIQRQKINEYHIQLISVPSKVYVTGHIPSALKVKR